MCKGRGSQNRKALQAPETGRKGGRSLYGLQIIKQVLEQGIFWDYLFEILLVMDREYLKGTTKHFRRLNGNHQATLDFLNNLPQTPEFSEYRFVFCYLSFWD
jgi:hypothetical protein